MDRFGLTAATFQMAMGVEVPSDGHYPGVVIL